MSEAIDFDGAVCPVPLRQFPNVVMGHGAGGKLSAELVEHLFLPAFNGAPGPLADAAVLDLGGVRLAISTDSFVVQPLFFPGGSIGELSVNGTVNDVAMMGARPTHLSAAFIVEEGFPLDRLNGIAQAMGKAAERAEVTLVTGDTKVVDHGHGDGVFITTTGVGLVPTDVSLGPDRVEAGDKVIVSGTMGDHGMAIMSVREGLEFEAEIRSDTAPLHRLVASVLEAAPSTHALRDPTRGGLAATLNEIAVASGIGIAYEESRLPVERSVAAACEVLGMDPVYVANEGKLVAFVPADEADAALEAMRSDPEGRNAAIIGEAVGQHAGMVVARTGIGGTRVVDTQIGEQLPRIC